VPDTAKKETSESERLQAGSTPPPGGNSAYTHLYYDKSFFEDFAKTENMKVKIFDQNIKEYGNSPFRFNVLLWRDK